MRTIHDVVELTGVPERTLRHYAKAGLLPEPDFGEVGSVGYGDRYLQVLAAILYLKQQGLRRLEVIKQRIDAMSEEELADYHFAPRGEGSAEDDGETGEEDEEDAEDEESAVPAAAAVPTPPPAVMQPAPSQVAATRERWSRILLHPGLELHLCEDADAQARQIAMEIQAKYVR